MTKLTKIKIEYDILGGKIPIISSENTLRKQIFPIVYSDNNIYYKNNIIINNQGAESYNLTDDFVFEKIIDSESETRIITTKNLVYLVNEHIVINAANIIPFHACLIDNNFNIITKFYKLIISKYIDRSIVLNEEIKFIDTIFKKYINLHNKTFQFIGLSARYNLLNKIIFANKLKEFLSFIYPLSDNVSDELDKEQIKKSYLNLFGPQETQLQNFINMSDLCYMFKKYTEISKSKLISSHQVLLPKEEIECEIDKLMNNFNNFTISNVNSFEFYFDQDYLEIVELIKFNKILNKIDTIITQFNIKLSHLFYACIIGHRLYHPSLSIGHLSSKLYPINVNSFIENLIGHPAILDSAIDLNPIKQIYSNSTLIPIYHPYGQSTFIDIEDSSKEYNFPDCVENTLLQLIKTLCWNPDNKKFNSDLLPSTTIQSLKTFINSLNDSNDNTKAIKNNFTSIVSNITELKTIYKNINKYEIESDLDNVVKLLFYLLGRKISTDYEKLIKLLKKKPSKSDIFRNKIIENIIIENKTIVLKLSDISIIFSFTPGHATHFVLSDDQAQFDSYIYRDLIVSLTSNYSFLTSISFNIHHYIKLMYKPVDLELDARTHSVKLYVNINELLLDSNLYFIDIINKGDLNYIDFYDIIINEPNFINYIKKLDKSDQLKLYYYTKFIVNTIFMLDIYPKLDIKILQLFRIIIDLIDDKNILIYHYNIDSDGDENIKRNIIYFLMTYFYKFCIYNSINIDNDIVYCNIIDKIIDPLMNKITNKLTFNQIFFTKSKSNNFYDLVAILPNRYQKYFCKFLDKKIILNISINKFIE